MSTWCRKTTSPASLLPKTRTPPEPHSHSYKDWIAVIPSEGRAAAEVEGPPHLSFPHCYPYPLSHSLCQTSPSRSRSAATSSSLLSSSSRSWLSPSRSCTSSSRIAQSTRKSRTCLFYPCIPHIQTAPGSSAASMPLRTTSTFSPPSACMTSSGFRSSSKTSPAPSPRRTPPISPPAPSKRTTSHPSTRPFPRSNPCPARLCCARSRSRPVQPPKAWSCCITPSPRPPGSSGNPPPSPSTSTTRTPSRSPSRNPEHSQASRFTDQVAPADSLERPQSSRTLRVCPHTTASPR